MWRNLIGKGGIGKQEEEEDVLDKPGDRMTKDEERKIRDEAGVAGQRLGQREEEEEVVGV